MAAALGVIFTILGLMAIGRALAAAAPPAWKLGELIVVVAVIALVRECIRFREAVKDIRRCRDPFAGATSGFAGSRSYARAVPHARTVPPKRTEANPQAAESESKLDGVAEIRADQSVEEIANLMVTQAFRKVSLKYHPDHGGDPEIMRRVYAAREMMLRAIHKN